MTFHITLNIQSDWESNFEALDGDFMSFEEFVDETRSSASKARCLMSTPDDEGFVKVTADSVKQLEDFGMISNQMYGGPSFNVEDFFDAVGGVFDSSGKKVA